MTAERASHIVMAASRLGALVRMRPGLTVAEAASALSVALPAVYASAGSADLLLAWDPTAKVERLYERPSPVRIRVGGTGPVVAAEYLRRGGRLYCFEARGDTADEALAALRGTP